MKDFTSQNLNPEFSWRFVIFAIVVGVPFALPLYLYSAIKKHAKS